MDARHDHTSVRGKRKAAAARSATTNAPMPKPISHALRIARDKGLLDGPKTKHFNVKVPPRLFDAAAKRLCTNSPATVIEAALATIATQDDLGPWLARNWGILSDLDPELLAQLDI